MKLMNKIRDFRKLSGLTQAHLVEMIGVSVNTISSYEVGSFTPSALHAAFLCEVFCCKFEDLFFIQDEYSIRDYVPDHSSTDFFQLPFVPETNAELCANVDSPFIDALLAWAGGESDL